MYLDVHVNLVSVPVNRHPLVDDTDFKTIETSINYDAAGMSLFWNFTTTAGVTTVTAVTPTTAGVHDWLHKNGGMYTIEIPASGGTINNASEGVGHFTGVMTGVLPFSGPEMTFRAAALNNALIDGGGVLDVNTAYVAGILSTGPVSDMINLTAIIPESVDIANTAVWRLGLMIINAIDDLPAAAEITPGTISIHRKAIGGTTWNSIRADEPCLELAGLIYYDEVFSGSNGYVEGDSIRFTFKNQKVTVGGNDFEITNNDGRFFYSEARQTMRGTNGANTATPPTIGSVRTEVDAALNVFATNAVPSAVAIPDNNSGWREKLNYLYARMVHDRYVYGNYAHIYDAAGTTILAAFMLSDVGGVLHKGKDIPPPPA